MATNAPPAHTQSLTRPIIPSILDRTGPIGAIVTSLEQQGHNQVHDQQRRNVLRTKIANRLQTGGRLQTNRRNSTLIILKNLVGARGFEPPTPSLPV
jgi:hypothetical protein